ncbi:amino acid kinase family protein [Limnoglobus roseus]|uniref:Amino acid kinase n=1 Tax=Limnoglobus roseus TaxID=2598579 RepID=A0A5C1AI16_9BACT|nr:hypothetical protein [Limnoglobus roseus]QEL16608.1 amino acid kinase [Limnoglobus roseus]
MIVVKLGGSLYDHPRLRDGLNHWLEAVPSSVLLVPGGGIIADGVRAFDELHRVGEEAAHWAAVRSLTVAAELVRAIVTRPDVEVLDALAFCRDEDQALPHTWDVTTDSIAARVAMVRNASKLVLLKSKDRPAGSWELASRQGFVDRHFPTVVRGVPLPIEVVNFRQWLDERVGA